jgi:DNA-binding GntR family transcriptional regulator
MEVQYRVIGGRGAELASITLEDVRDMYEHLTEHDKAVLRRTWSACAKPSAGACESIAALQAELDLIDLEV